MKHLLVGIFLAPLAAFAQTSDIPAKEKKAETIIHLNCGASKITNPPLWIVNGLMMPDSLVKTINPNGIQSINVSKDAAAIQKYGDKARYGVIEITLKEAAYKKMQAEGYLIPIL